MVACQYKDQLIANTYSFPTVWAARLACHCTVYVYLPVFAGIIAPIRWLTDGQLFDLVSGPIAYITLVLQVPAYRGLIVRSRLRNSPNYLVSCSHNYAVIVQYEHRNSNCRPCLHLQRYSIIAWLIGTESQRPFHRYRTIPI